MTRMTVVFAAMQGGAVGSSTMDIASMAQARRHVAHLLSVGNRDVTAEVIDDNGDVIHTYEQGRGWRQETK